jgi:LPXTG-motif cell wall-anchored protein
LAGLVASLLWVVVGAVGATTAGADEPGSATGTATPTAPASAPGENDTASPTASAPGQLTVTLAKNCEANSVDATIVNGTAAAVTVAVTKLPGPTVDSVTVAPGATGLLRVRGTFADPLDLTYTRVDTGAVVGTFQTDLWICPRRFDVRIRVVSGTTYTSPVVCPGFGTGGRTRHGLLRPASPRPSVGERFTYSPDRGYVGPDQFDYSCVTSAEAFGTYFITVLPTPPAHALPPPARVLPPQLPATGPSGLPPLLAVAVGLLLAGTATTWLARRQRRP